MKKVFLKIAQSLLNGFIPLFDYSYCVMCKKIILEERIRYNEDRGVKYDKGCVLSNRRECPVCMRELEKLDVDLSSNLEEEEA